MTIERAPLSDESHRLRDELTALRDTIRLKIHLAGMEVKREWTRLDPQVRQVEDLFARGPVGEARRMAHDVNQAMRELVERRLPQPRAEDVMTESPRVCRPGDTLADAASIMWERDCGVVPVVDGEDHAVGVVTDRDICMGVLTQGGSLTHRRVADAMSRKIVTCRRDEPLDVVARAMIDHQVRRVVIVDEARKVVGVVSLADISRHCHDRELVAQVLFAVSAPRMQDQ